MAWLLALMYTISEWVALCVIEHHDDISPCATDPL